MLTFEKLLYIMKLQAKTKDIETIKSQISSLKGTIEFQQTKKQSITDPVEYNNITKQINQNITDRKQLELNYSTSLSTMLQQMEAMRLL